MLGRSLGGGAYESLVAIPGMHLQLSIPEIGSRLSDDGMVFAADLPEVAPVDRKLYALRDVTATVANLPMIAGINSVSDPFYACAARRDRRFR